MWQAGCRRTPDLSVERNRGTMAEKGGANNFDALRLLAALLVMWSHSYPALAIGPDPIAGITRWLSGGEIGLATFFVISGFLVTISAGNRTLFEFAAARALRILPALFVVTLLTIFVLGPIFTTLPLLSYAKAPDTARYFGNLYIYGNWFILPGTFKALPLAGVVNGPLWTLPLEVTMYAIVFVLTAAGLRTRLFSLIVAALFIVGFVFAVLYLELSWGNRGPLFLFRLQLYPFLRFGVFFFIGAAFSFWGDKIPLRLPFALTALISVCVTSVWMPSLYFVYFAALPYLVFYVALALPAIDLRKIGDLSYGTYLFAFPVQQGVVQIFGTSLGVWGLMSMVVPVVLATAFLSWRYVEKPCLAWKDRAPYVREIFGRVYRLALGHVR